MPITRIGQATATGGTGSDTAITTALPAGVASGDLLILEVATGVGPYTVTNNQAGWTYLRRIGDLGTAPQEAALEIWWKIAAASNTAPTLTASTATRWHTCIRVFRGVDSSAPFLAENAAAETGPSSTTVHTAPTLSNTDTGAWGLYSLASRQVASPYTATPGPGLTQRVDQESGNASTANVMYFAADSNGVVPTGSVTYSATGSAGSAIAAMWAALLKPAGGDTSIAGVTADVTVQAPAGAVSDGSPANVSGVTATVVVQGGNVPVAQPVVAGPEWPPAPYRDAIRSGGYSLVHSVSATLGGAPVAGAQDLRPTGGSITDTSRPGVRRVLNLELAPEPGLFDKLSPIGTTLTVTAKVTYLNRSTQDIPMGVFDVDSEKSSDGRGGISIVAPDKWVRIQRARFVLPDRSTPGVSVQTQISALLAYSGSNDPPMVDYTTRAATMGPLVWEKDRDKAIMELAESIGAWCYYDRNGVPTLADIPTAGASADWLIDSGSNGVLTSLDRERSRTDTCNVVVVESSAAEGSLFPTQYVWDDDPASPTYAGTNPATQPQTAGPFGLSTYYFDTPVLRTVAVARAAGKSILARVSGLASQVSLGSVPNPAMDALDVIDVLPLRERYDIPRRMERHVVDVVTHPLLFGEQRIEGRSTRIEEITGGS